MSELLIRFRLRRDISTSWTSVNPVLGDGEQAYETDTGKMKIGDGILNWTSLPYFAGGGSGGGPTGPTGATGATGPQGATGAQGPISAYGFDGGFPSIVYTSGPVFDMGGVN